MAKRVALFFGCAAASLSLATMAVVDAQAQSRNRRGEAAPAQPTAPPVSRPFATAYQAVNTAITASDFAAADTALEALRAVAASPYERYLAAQTEFRIASLQRNTARQLTALDGMIDSEGAPVAELPRVLVASGQLAYNSGAFARAADRMAQAIAAGATNDGLDILRLDALFRSNQAAAANSYGQELIAAARAAGRTPSDEVYGLIARGLQEAGNDAELARLLVQRTGDHPNANNVRSATLAILNASDEDRSRSTDLMRLMLAAGAMNDRRFYLEYASNLAEDGLPNEALAGIQAGRAANVIASDDPTFREIESTQRDKLADDRASLAGTERRAAASPDARLAQLVADAYYGYGNYTKAEELYRLALTKNGANRDLINTRIGITLFGAGNYAGAIEAFALVQTAPRSDIAALWTAIARSRIAAAAAPAAAAPETPADAAPAS